MKSLSIQIVSVFLLIFLITGCNEGKFIEGDNLIVLGGATLIDGTGNEPQKNATIVLEGNRIVHVGIDERLKFPEDATIHDLTDKYIVPGFMDLHLHVRGIDMMNQILAFGITTIRSPQEPSGQGIEMRQRLAGGDLIGPNMFTADISIDDPNNQIAMGDVERIFWTPGTTEIEIRNEVRRQASLGVDYIKLYMGIPKDLVEVAVEEAHSLGIKVAGHLHRTSWTDAANAGIDVLVHSATEGPSWELLGDDNDVLFPWGDFKNYLLAWAKTAQQVDFKGLRMKKLISALVNNNVEVNPTLVLEEALCWGNDIMLLERLEPSVAPDELKDRWWGENWEEANPFMRSLKLSDVQWAQLKVSYAKTKDMIRVFHENGVLLTAGSDVGMPWITPGVGFHRELELLVSSGISPLDVLSIATRNGAKALGILDEVGTVETGKYADLVVLKSNPVEDIRNTREIEMVIKDGLSYVPSELLLRATY